MPSRTCLTGRGRPLCSRLAPYWFGSWCQCGMESRKAEDRSSDTVQAFVSGPIREQRSERLSLFDRRFPDDDHAGHAGDRPQGEGVQMPFVTRRSWLGGAISAEYQHAISNPVSVSLYVLMDRFGRLDKVLCPRRPRRQHPGPLLNRPFRSARNRAGGLRPREWRLRSRPRKRAACQRRGSGPGL